MTIEFKAWPKIARLNREVIITEKLDGTNAAIIIEKQFRGDESIVNGVPTMTFGTTGEYDFGTQSRNRLITPEDDNYGFARWAYDNKEALIKMLGEGRHFGEWWGAGIQRNYGLKNNDKRFSLFNIDRYKDVDFSLLPNVGLVPEIKLYGGLEFTLQPSYIEDAKTAIDALKRNGSIAVPGYMNPEGIVVFHTASNSLFKVTCTDDEKPKGA